MSSLVNRFKSGAGKAAFEADKLRRMQVAQSAIKPLRNEAERLIHELGKLAYSLHTQSAIDASALLPTCERIDEFYQRIAVAEVAVEGIRAEQYVEPTPMSSILLPSGLICPNGHGALVVGATFCQKCGAAGIQPVAQKATIPCTNCGAPLDPAARFCASCGLAVKRCANCDALLLPDAVYCAECGASTGEETSPLDNETLSWPDASDWSEDPGPTSV